MSFMYPEYDEKLWKVLQGTITAGSSRTAYSTYADVDSNSTGAMGAAPAATSACLCYVAYEKPKNRVHLMYWFST